MSDEYMDTEEANNLLDRVIAKSNIGRGENRDGRLTDEQSAEFTRDTDWESPVYVYREFKPTRDVIEYTVFFRAPVDGVSKKFRADWEVDLRDLKSMIPEGEDMTPYIVFALKQECRIAKRANEYLYRTTGTEPAVRPSR